MHELQLEIGFFRDIFATKPAMMKKMFVVAD